MDRVFFGSIIFEAIGVFFRWMYLCILGKIKGHRTVTLKQVWEGKENPSSQGNIEYGFSNIILGIMIGMSIIIIIKLPDV